METGSVIAMDGAYCLKTEDGNLVIKERLVSVVFAVAVLVLVPICVLGLALNGLLREGPRAEGLGPLTVILPLVAFVTALMVTFTRPLHMPSIHVNARSRVVEIGEGPTARRIPFSRLSYIALGTREGPMMATVIDIQVVLDDGDAISLGSASGAEPGAHARAADIAQRIADITGVQSKKAT